MAFFPGLEPQRLVPSYLTVCFGFFLNWLVFVPRCIMIDILFLLYSVKKKMLEASELKKNTHLTC